MDISAFTPEEFALEVIRLVAEASGRVQDFRIDHRQKLTGPDGTYELDAAVRFSSLGVDFLVLLECKHVKNPVKRDVVVLLHDKVRSLGAHKGIHFSTAGFQKGAIEYAWSHGVALFQVG
jgi:restriction system protein